MSTHFEVKISDVGMEWICKCSNDLVTHTASSPTMCKYCLTLPRSYLFDGYHQKSGIVQMKSSTCQPGQTFGLSKSLCGSCLLMGNFPILSGRLCKWSVKCATSTDYPSRRSAEIGSTMCWKSAGLRTTLTVQASLIWSNSWRRWRPLQTPMSLSLIHI